MNVRRYEYGNVAHNRWIGVRNAWIGIALLLCVNVALRVLV